MAGSGWNRAWRTAQPLDEQAGVMVRAAIRNDSLEQLLELGARTLLAATSADRAALWLIGDRGGDANKCHVAEATPGPIPEQWKRLDLSTPLLRAAIESLEPIRIELDSAQAMSDPVLLAGMRSAIWIALRTRNRTLGLAVVAHAHANTAAHPETLRARTEEISLAVAHYRERRRRELAAEGLRCQACISRAILCGVSVDSILPQIARAARRYVPAQFMALSRELAIAEGWDGRDEFRASLDHESLVRLIRASFEESRQIEIAGDDLPVHLRTTPDSALPALDRIIAIPIEARNRTCGVLIAGLASSEEPSDDMSVLESYALLAASALEREAFREEQAASRRALLEAEERSQTELLGLTDSIDSGVLLLDSAGNIRMMSNRFAQIMELDARVSSELRTVDALIDLLAGRLAHPAETAARWLAQLRRGEEAGWDELEIVRPSRKVVERFARPLLHADGTRFGWLEVYRDITGQRLVQTKLLQAEKMAALGQLVSGVAHELNNPLTSIHGYAQLLLGRRSASDRAADARRISEEAGRASRIVKNLLLFSRETKPERRAVDLNEVVERTLALRAYELKIENIMVDLDLAAGLSRILADAAQLQQVVLNLLVNAEQAIQQGPGRGCVAIRTRRLAGDRIGLEISDDGPGISPEVISRIFDPFFTTKPVGVGTGLGLSIAYGIVHEHGGEISVESEPGVGAVVRLEFRALAGAAGHLAGHVAGGHVMKPPVTSGSSASIAVLPASSLTRGAARRQRILVLEDEPTVAQLIADVVSGEGHRVDTLLDSRQALSRLEEKDYDLIICDLKMPHLDGPGFHRALVHAAHPLQHRLLFVTGDTMSPRTLEFLNSRGLPYLAKPFLVEELKQALRRSLDAAPADAVPVDEESVVRAAWLRAIVRGK